MQLVEIGGRAMTYAGVARKGVRRGLAVAISLCTVCLSAPAVTSALPEGRHYEMVSPPYKGGYGVFEGLGAVAMGGGPEGERVAFRSLGSFNGEPNSGTVSYFASRSASGWQTAPMQPPAAVATANLDDVSPTLESSLFSGKSGSNSGAAEFDTLEPEFLAHSLGSSDAPYEVLARLRGLGGKQLEVNGSAGVSTNLCHVVFEAVGESNRTEALLPEAANTRSDLYEITSGAAGCGGELELRLVGVGNEVRPDGEHEVIDPYCLVQLGFEGVGGEGSQFNAVSADGSEIFFTTNANVAQREQCDGKLTVEPNNPAILYARLNGQRTVQVSKPIAADCESGPCLSSSPKRAVFEGANEAGTRVFFETHQPLVTGDVGESEDLYMAAMGCPNGETSCDPSEREVTGLTQISQSAAAGEAAEVQGVSAISPDGGRVYFVARGVLVNGANSEQQSPIKGADNLYVYDAGEGVPHLEFIADLCSGPITSGEIRESRCPSDLESTGEGGREKNDIGLWGAWKEVQTAGPDGRFFVFSTYARLTEGDTDNTQDVYRYDALTGALQRVSVGEEGFDSDGNDDRSNAEFSPLEPGAAILQDHELTYRNIDETGSRIVFESASPLSQHATNGLINAYEWHIEPGWSEGKVSLISTGSDAEGVGARRNEVAITPSGRDIFFMTTEGLLPQDDDNVKDIYDARLGEGFVEGNAHEEECEGEGCFGPLTNPAPLLAAGSTTQTPGETLPQPATFSKVTSKKGKPAKCRKGYVRRKARCVRAKARRTKVGRSTKVGKSTKAPRHTTTVRSGTQTSAVTPTSASSR